MNIAHPVPIPHLPPALLTQHNCAVPTDTRYRAAARLGQALWREAQGHACGRIPDARTGRPRKLGSLLTQTVARTGSNLADRALIPFVRQALALAEPGAAVNPDRLWTNLLSSHALTFSLFGPLAQELDLATRVFSELFPDLCAYVTDILFEHSPSRADPAFTGDRTAFDVLVRCTTPDNRRAFIAIEVKYTEAPGGAPYRSSPRQDALSRAAGIFTDPMDPALRTGAAVQFWRQQLLAQAVVERGLYDEGRVVVLAPLANRDCWSAVARYTRHHTSTDPIEARFEAITLERMIAAIARAGADATATRLAQRYLDMSPVEDAVQRYWAKT